MFYTMPYAVAVPLGHVLMRTLVENALVDIFANEGMRKIEEDTVRVVDDGPPNLTVECNSEKLATDYRICEL